MNASPGGPSQPFPSERIQNALRQLALSPSAVRDLRAWIGDTTPDSRLPLRRNIGEESHLATAALVTLLTAIYSALNSRGDWAAAVVRWRSDWQLKGDPVRCPGIDLLDRAIRVDYLPEILRIPAAQAGPGTRFFLSRAVSDPFRGWRFAGPNLAVWVTFVGVAELAGKIDPRGSGPRTMPPWYHRMRADEARDLLGLSDYRRGNLMIMLTYRRPEGAPRELKFPTIADGNPPFRPAPSSFPCSVTRRLSSGKFGMPEALHPAVVADGLIVEWEALGEIQGDASPSSPNAPNMEGSR